MLCSSEIKYLLVVEICTDEVKHNVYELRNNLYVVKVISILLIVSLHSYCLPLDKEYLQELLLQLNPIHPLHRF